MTSPTAARDGKRRGRSEHVLGGIWDARIRDSVDSHPKQRTATAVSGRGEFSVTATTPTQSLIPNWC